MTGQPLISAITIFLNGERFIRDAIESVLAQTYLNWELVLVDDGSTDGSSATALAYAKRFRGKIRYLEHEGHRNRGMSGSRNAGIREARGQYVALLDADDVWLPNKLTEQVAILEAHPDAAMVYGSTQYWYGWAGRDGERDHICDVGVPPDTVVRPPTLLNLLLGSTHTPCPSDIMVRRATIERVGGFEERFVGPLQLYEDQAFMAKVYLHDAVFVSNRCWDKYRIHDDSCDTVVTRAGRQHEVRAFFLNWLKGYLSESGVQDTETANLLDAALAEIPTADEESETGRESRRMQWWLRVGADSTATLEVLDSAADRVRVGIERIGTGLSHDIQLNEARLEIAKGCSYVVALDARAASDRSISVGCSQAFPPWGNLGLYRQITIGTDWQHFEFCFDSQSDAVNGRIHFDLGDSSISVELRRVRLRRMSDGHVIEPDIPGFRREHV